ncbi:MAG: NAD(+) synthase [Alistipes sp.]|nr:NAD(+) synthase [Alistipes sp.]
MQRFGYVKVAAAIPRVAVADCRTNAARIVEAMGRAAERGARIVLFPELSVTGYTCADLFLQPLLLRSAEEALADIARATAELPLTAIVGVPVAVGSKLYNCAAVLSEGRIRGLVPKVNIPNYSEFYEARWFASGAGVAGTAVTMAGDEVPFGTDLLFRADDALFGVEICEDLWVGIPPSSHLAQAGAQIVFNLSASPEQVCKYDYLRTLVEQQSARTLAAYVYCSAGFGESSTDLVFAGNALIAENGAILRSGERFRYGDQIVTADVDTERLDAMRRRMTTYGMPTAGFKIVDCPAATAENAAAATFDRDVDPMPFVPHDTARLDERCSEILGIQAMGLARRLDHTRCKRAVIGISGGLDSTLALLATVTAFDRLGLDRSGIIGVTMPGFGTTDRTYRNAVELIRGLGVTLREISIRKACEQHFADIGLPADDRSVSYENSQARERTQILMDIANMEGGMVIGTGDLSELALGWATYNGDHMSMYGVNCSVPKTLVRHLVKWTACQPSMSAVRDILIDITETPVSPELLPADENGEIAQKTEDLVGRFELRDFFLYDFVRQQFSPAKILFLAEKAFDGKYDTATIRKWLATFLRCFFAQQFKRSAMPDGSKTGSVSLSPRGDWRMPSDASAAEWTDEMKE